MAAMPVRRLGVALLAAAVVFTTGTVSAANLTLTAPGHVGAYQQANTAPCHSVFAWFTLSPPPLPQYVDTIRLTGSCTGTSTSLTVKFTLENVATHPETIVETIVSSTANAINTGTLIVDVSSLRVASCGLVLPIAVLVTGS